MQKREQGKSGGAAGGAATPAAKRGRPFGSTSGSSGGSGSAADSAAPTTLLGPSLQVHSSFADQNHKRIVLALQSGLKSELTWALNTLTLLSFKEKDDMRKDATPLAKIPGLLDALLQVIDDWRDIALPKELSKGPRARTLGVNSLVTGFGSEFEALGSINNAFPRSGVGSGSSAADSLVQKNAARVRSSEWWFDEDGLFNLDDEGRAEKQQCAVGASNIIRNFSFMPDNEVIMAQHRHCLETVFQCIEDHVTAWHCAAAELLGRLIINPDNEPFLLPFVPQIHKRLVDLMSLPAFDAQAAAVGALYNLAEVNVDCRLKLASERWAIDRLLRVIKTPHPVPEVCRKAAMILESLVSEPQNRVLLLAYENAFAEILFSDGRYSDTFARILYELTSRPNNKVASARGIWGCG
ncbi:armadillo repeat-containing protein LFR [Citrus sinensis]|nr:armadillo repeat-containing protein LFR [Citrus sinensis]